MVTYKIKRCAPDWRTKLLEKLPEKFHEIDAIKIGLNGGDLQNLKSRGFIRHITIYRDTGYYEKYKMCSRKEIRKKTKPK